jgi:hypothetical protein
MIRAKTIPIIKKNKRDGRPIPRLEDRERIDGGMTL